MVKRKCIIEKKIVGPIQRFYLGQECLHSSGYVQQRVYQDILYITYRKGRHHEPQGEEASDIIP